MGARIHLFAFTVLAVTLTWQGISYFDFQEQVKQFQAKGPRFTAMDGQALCERIRKLEKEPKPCEYGVK